MTAITGLSASSYDAYAREASRLVSPTPDITTKVVTQDSGLQLGPFSVRYSSTDYEFDLSGFGQMPDAFGDTLDAATQSRDLYESQLAASARSSTPAENAISLRQALASYQYCQDMPLTMPISSFTATA